MKFVMIIKLDNADFRDADDNFVGERELARIIRVSAAKIEEGMVVGTAKDTNGNTVGEFQIQTD